MKKILSDLNVEELKEVLIGYGEPPYRAKQIYQSLHLGRKISEITAIPTIFREKLLETYEDEPVKIVEQYESSDGTKKFLFALADGNLIEGVLMHYKYGYSQCVSTQVGCRMRCKFCASGLDGLIRNLSSGEILGQILTVNRYLGGTGKERKVTNIVLMGSGEPLDNYENTIKFIKNVGSPDGINISLRNISLSTSGLVPQIRRFADEGFGVNLALSLHNPFDEKRSELMPIAKKYSVSELCSALDYYFEKTSRRYILEYSLIKGENDTKECLTELFRLFKGKPCHINLIRLNVVKESGLMATDEKAAFKFAGELEKGGISVSVRRQIGADIEGACGQLRRKYLENKE